MDVNPMTAAKQFVGTWSVVCGETFTNYASYRKGDDLGKVSFNEDGTGTVENGEKSESFYYGVNWHGELRTVENLSAICLSLHAAVKGKHYERSGFLYYTPFTVSPDGDTIIVGNIVLKRQK
ncbi:hypothetical protein R80B4_01084 [Fibrobacteres bacterium R8-0-B4]